MSSPLQSPLLEYLATHFPEKPHPQIKKLRSLTEGWENIIYAFDLVSGPWLRRRREKLILRIFPGNDAYEKSEREFIGMKQLFTVEYPVPKVLLLERGKSPFDEQPFIVMERIVGEKLWPVLSRSSEKRRQQLGYQFVTLLAQLHTLDWQLFVPAAERTTHSDPYTFVDQWLAMAHEFVDQFPTLAAFDPVLEWLQAQRDRVPCTQPAPIHYDFHPANAILRPNGEIIVIDWTQFQISDPRFDLAWTMLLMFGYEGPEVREFILNAYQELRGSQVEQLDFFEVASALKRLGSVMASITVGADQMGMRPDASAAMRRDFPMLRRVYDLMVDRCGVQVPEVAAMLRGD